MGTFINLPKVNDFQDAYTNGVYLFDQGGYAHYFGSTTDNLYKFARVGNDYFWISNEQTYYLQAKVANGAVTSASITERGNIVATVQGVTVYYNHWTNPTSPILVTLEPYNSFEEMVSDIFGSAVFPITYRPTNCSFPNAPTEAVVGDTVVVPVTFPDGYGLVNESNIYVTSNGVVIPSTYSNGQLTFTMPDPS